MGKTQLETKFNVDWMVKCLRFKFSTYQSNVSGSVDRISYSLEEMSDKSYKLVIKNEGLATSSYGQLAPPFKGLFGVFAQGLGQDKNGWTVKFRAQEIFSSNGEIGYNRTHVFWKVPMKDLIEMNSGSEFWVVFSGAEKSVWSSRILEILKAPYYLVLGVFYVGRAVLRLMAMLLIPGYPIDLGALFE